MNDPEDGTLVVSQDTKSHDWSSVSHSMVSQSPKVTPLPFSPSRELSDTPFYPLCGLSQKGNSRVCESGPGWKRATVRKFPGGPTGFEASEDHLPAQEKQCIPSGRSS